MNDVEWLPQRKSFILLFRQECTGEGDYEDANPGHSRIFFEKSKPKQVGDQTLRNRGEDSESELENRAWVP